jgi:hypothetical protein
MEENQIPSVTIENNQVVLSELDVPLNVNGTVINVKMRRLPAGVRNQIKKKYTKTSMRGKEPVIDIDDGGYSEEVVHKAIVEAPFDYSLEGIRKLPSEVLDYLFSRYVDLAEPTEKKNG